ncbi:hypothetical protein GOBAR_AA22348 [Gossypium barbadense]|uniref:Uncharacterized protein n=1 Tax=Gossypium barbadense TaxID=3634 RepID=A0A2P5X4R7_GOSBA|nr:hypothetical protein GOBAR_AA22348 [Gossypium barbadense]
MKAKQTREWSAPGVVQAETVERRVREMRISRSLKNGTAVRNFICGGEMMVGTCHIAIAIAIVLSLMGFCIDQPSPFVGGPSTRGASLLLGP